MPGLAFEWVLEMSDDDLVDALAQERGVPRTEVIAPAERVPHAPPPREARVAR